MENKKSKKTKKELKQHEERMKLIEYRGKVNLDIDLDVLRDRNAISSTQIHEMKIKDQIIIDEIETWPLEILEIINTSKEVLKLHLQDLSRIGQLCQENIEAKMYPPKKDYLEKWEEIVNAIEKKLENKYLVGFHCTRLTEEEVEDVQINGLKPLNNKFAIKRINTLHTKGLISSNLGSKLKNKKELSEDNRKGFVSVFFQKSILKRDKSGLINLLRYWGGESMYLNIQNPEELEKIGFPCIVLASVPIFLLKPQKVSEMMISFYFNDLNFGPEPMPLLKTGLKVLEIVKYEDSKFDYICDYKIWLKQI